MNEIIIKLILVCIISKLEKIKFRKKFYMKIKPQKDIKSYFKYLFNQAIS